MDTSLVYAALLSFVIVLAAGPMVITYLRRLKLGQAVRTVGPKEHLKKAGTPNMGGILILLGMSVSALAFGWGSPAVLYTLLVTVGYGIIGLADDWLKAVKKHSMGLKARYKLLGQILLALLFGGYLLNSGNAHTIYLPFSNLAFTPPGWLFLVLVTGVLTGSANAVNFTDGLDGLASGTTAIAALAYAILCGFLQRPDMAVLATAMAGACLGFVWYNSHPAQIIMGDTGSLALGAGLGCISIFTGTELLLPIVGGVFVLETLSIIIQVTYFRLTKGRRIFRMAPIHHHFELEGWAETKVVFRFWIAGFVFALLGLISLLQFLK